ncbi:adenylate/guanylate cyclase domain-containing protein [Chloroflexus sp.]|uniref:adenylate/guanylate cyclase domain-containing protein n=1 Tax=Chloroflexus sp. TaxID=1904827 RepID=UPI00298EDEAE|nr:adenylate/guanylate cyclase domain-containing protein [Chloroflexus sp.]MDW8404328.1 adenylate/guanylate cyclase domain-containing protein [Chloroflexus sp.]
MTQLDRNRIARYLGATQAQALLSNELRPHELYAACAHLANAQYALTTYLPRRLVTYRLATTDNQPWLEWVDGTLLFADISGSTALAERLSSLGREGAEIVTDTLNTYFGALIRRIQQAGGDLLTFGGDALLVLFTDPDHAYTATVVARDMLDAQAGFVREVPGIGSFPLTMHIGVESGRVALVSAGRSESLRYSAMGACVERVARAEELGGKGEIVLGPQAWAMVEGRATGDALIDGYIKLHAITGNAPQVSSPPHAVPPPPTRDTALHLIWSLERLSPYLPPILVDRIIAEPQRPQLEADLRPVSILFAQIEGLAPLVESLPATTTAHVIDAVWRVCFTAIEQYGGYVNKIDLATEGSKLLAIFGAPIAQEDHHERAARAALELQRAFQTLTTAQPAGIALDHLRLRIGLNSGNVFAGNVGDVERKEYTVMGDAVNVAARVMAHSDWGEIRATTPFAISVGTTIAFADSRVISARGKREPIELLRLVGIREAPVPSTQHAIVGRKYELAWLQERLAIALAGRGRVARISGEAGIGKTRLAAELLVTSAPRSVKIVTVRCLSYQQSTPYAPWSDALQALCAIPAGAEQATRAAHLRQALAAAGIEDEWAPIVADLVKLDIDDNALTRSLSPQQRQTRRFEIIRAIVHTTAAANGLILIFDNLQWADRISLELWRYIASSIAQARIFLLGLHRDTLQWDDNPLADGAEVLTLSELPARDSAALIAAIPAGARLDPQVQAQIIARAAGNPLFIEELVRAVQQGNTNLDELPDSLSGLLLSRIDQLDERSRALLRVAAVVGQRFPLPVLQSVYGEDTRRLIEYISQLDAQELTLLEREVPERVHTFRHALLHEVTYQSMLFARRRELHRRIGEYLEQRYAEELRQIRHEFAITRQHQYVQIGRNGPLMTRAVRAIASPIYLLAHHYRLSDAPERAIQYLLLAGHLARDEYANEQAITYYRWALDIIGERGNEPRLWEAMEALGETLAAIGKYDEAQQTYQRLLELGNDQLPPVVQAETLRSWGAALEKQGRYQEALERLRKAEAIAGAAINRTPPLLLAAIAADLAQTLTRLSAFDEALAMCEAGLSRIRDDQRSIEDEWIEAELQQQLGMIHGMQGRYERARYHFLNALSVQEAIGDVHGCARTNNNLGYLEQLQSNYAVAIEHYARAEQLARKGSAKYALSSALLNTAYAHYRLANYDAAEAACREALALCEEMGDRLGMAQADDTLGIIAYARGDYQQALHVYQQALQLYTELQNTYQYGNTLALAALAATANGDPKTALAYAAEACQIGEHIKVPQLIVEALCASAEALLAQARQADQNAERARLLQTAAEYAARAAEQAEQIGSRLDQAVALRLMGEIAAERGEPFSDYFTRAMTIFTAINCRFEHACAAARFGHALYQRNLPEARAYIEFAKNELATIGANGELRRLAEQAGEV